MDDLSKIKLRNYQNLRRMVTALVIEEIVTEEMTVKELLEKVKHREECLSD